MAEKEGYTVTDIYQGGYSAFEPSPTSPYFSTGSFAMTTDPRTANILQDVSTKLSAGVKNIEIEGVSPEVFDAIPKQQLKEVNRLSKLTGVNLSIHAPVINVSGIDSRSGSYSEAERENAERKVEEALERSHEADPDGNIPVNFHSAEGIPGSQMLPPGERETFEPIINKEGNVLQEGYEKKHKILLAIDQETGRIDKLDTDTKYYPGGPGGEVIHEIIIPEQNLKILNNTEWKNSLAQIEFNREHAERILKDTHGIYREIALNLLTVEGRKKIEKMGLSLEEQAELEKIYSAQEYVKQAEINLNAAFNKAYKYGTDKEKELLKKASEEYSKTLGVNEEGQTALKQFDPKTRSEATYQLLQALQQVKPKSHIPLEDFAIEKTSKTFGWAAYDSFKKFNKKGQPAPILTIENPPAGFALSTGEDLKNLVEASRKEFVQKAIKDGMKEKDAKIAAEKHIGATIDLGHMNMLRKYGYSDEEIAGEAGKMAPYLKHMHLSDNFGFEHTELPMGMGNVPTKEMMQQVEKKLGKEKAAALRKVIEAGSWWTHFRSSPFQATLEHVGSPVYSTRAAPYWSQKGAHPDYYGGLGQFLPQINYETFGAGFSQLPTELGGQRPGAGGSRMSGRPME